MSIPHCLLNLPPFDSWTGAIATADRSRDGERLWEWVGGRGPTSDHMLCWGCIWDSFLENTRPDAFLVMFCFVWLCSRNYRSLSSRRFCTENARNFERDSRVQSTTTCDAEPCGGESTISHPPRRTRLLLLHWSPASPSLLAWRLVGGSLWWGQIDSHEDRLQFWHRLGSRSPSHCWLSGTLLCSNCVSIQSCARRLQSISSFLPLYHRALECINSYTSHTKAYYTFTFASHRRDRNWWTWRKWRCRRKNKSFLFATTAVCSPSLRRPPSSG